MDKMYEWWGVSAIKKGSDENSKHKNTTSEIKNYPDRLVQQMGQAEERISEFEDRKFLYKNEKRRTISEKKTQELWDNIKLPDINETECQKEKRQNRADEVCEQITVNERNRQSNNYIWRFQLFSCQ